MKNKVYADLPRVGLSNRLFVWAKSLVYSSHNSFPLFVNGWNVSQIGPWLRRERVKRVYMHYFNHKSDKLGFWLRVRLHRKTCLYEPSSLLHDTKYTTIIFDQINNKKDYFKGLREHRELIKSSLISSLTATYQNEYFNTPSPCIGIHIRRGDFNLINQASPIQYYIDCLQTIRNGLNQDVPARIFSDGYENELKSILAVPNVEFRTDCSDIIDLLTLSKSKIIITSNKSTFSYWASFLSETDSVTINPPEYEGGRIKIKSDSLFEGVLEQLDFETLKTKL